MVYEVAQLGIVMFWLLYCMSSCELIYTRAVFTCVRTCVWWYSRSLCCLCRRFADFCVT